MPVRLRLLILLLVLVLVLRRRVRVKRVLLELVLLKRRRPPLRVLCSTLHVERVLLLLLEVKLLFVLVLIPRDPRGTDGERGDSMRGRGLRLSRRDGIGRDSVGRRERLGVVVVLLVVLRRSCRRVGRLSESTEGTALRRLARRSQVIGIAQGRRTRTAR